LFTQQQWSLMRIIQTISHQPLEIWVNALPGNRALTTATMCHLIRQWVIKTDQLAFRDLLKIPPRKLRNSRVQDSLLTYMVKGNLNLKLISTAINKQKENKLLLKNQQWRGLKIQRYNKQTHLIQLMKLSLRKLKLQLEEMSFISQLV
jgi:hypothetical protein